MKIIPTWISDDYYKLECLILIVLFKERSASEENRLPINVNGSTVMSQF